MQKKCNVHVSNLSWSKQETMVPSFPSFISNVTAIYTRGGGGAGGYSREV